MTSYEQQRWTLHRALSEGWEGPEPSVLGTHDAEKAVADAERFLAWPKSTGTKVPPENGPEVPLQSQVVSTTIAGVMSRVQAVERELRVKELMAMLGSPNSIERRTAAHLLGTLYRDDVERMEREGRT